MTDCAVVIQNLTKTFGKVRALDNLSLTFAKGKITGLIGADGAGKTTLLRLICGLLVPDSGQILTLGENPVTDKDKIISQIGYMPQKFGLYEDLSVIENLRLYADLKGVPYQFDRLLKFTDLAAFQNRLAGQLSGGMKQKLGLACAFLGNPKLLILDEPSVGVDPISRQDLLKMVQSLIDEDTTVIWSTAYMDEAHRFHHTVVLDKGRLIYDGAPQDLAENTAAFENKIIDLMGGYQEHPSLIAEHYQAHLQDLPYTVEACYLVKRYGDFFAVKDNSFQIKKGEIFGLLGPNGAGKSTSFKMMCGLSRPTSGTAKIMGVDICQNPSKARAHLGYMAQKFSLYANMSVWQNLSFFAGVYGVHPRDREARLNEILQVFGLLDYRDAVADELPLGIKQRLSMAAALIHNPAVLFLDEPTSGVDVITRRDFWMHIRALAKKGVTVLITTHFMDEAEFCDRISLFYKGETIALGTPQALKDKAEASSMEEAFIRLIKEREA